VSLAADGVGKSRAMANPSLPFRIKRERTLYALGRLYYGLPFAGGRGAKTKTRLPRVSLADSWPGQGQRGQDIVAGLFDLAGERYEIAANVLPQDIGEVAVRELHAFHWLRDLRAHGGEASRRCARERIQIWLRQCQRWHPLVWHPAVIGDRLANWMTHFEFYSANAEADLRAALLQSVARQAQHLASVLPAGLLGWEIVASLKGLVAAGASLQEGDPWLRQARGLLDRELVRQINADGMQAERSPALQLRVLMDLIDLRAWYHAAGVDAPAGLADTIRQMGPVLKIFQSGDGGLALFNGSNENERLIVDLALQRVGTRIRPLTSAPQSGFQKLQAGRLQVVVDCGEPPRPGYDGRAHAGLLSFEVSAGRQRLFVNCGSHLGDKSLREPLRSTAAHTTLTLDDHNACELVPGGGIGRRPQVVDCRRDELDDRTLLELYHDGYRARYGLLHRRRIALSSRGELLAGEDTLEGRRPGLSYAVRFHLHPAVRASPLRGGGVILLRLPRGEGWRFHCNDGDLALEPSIYLGQAGKPRRSQQIVVSGVTEEEGATVVWWLQREAAQQR